MFKSEKLRIAVRYVCMLAVCAVLIAAFSMTSVYADTQTTESGYKYAIEGIDGKDVAVIKGASKTIVDVKIPSSIDGYPVTKIDGYSFSEDLTIKTIEIPGTVSEIGECAFRGCKNVTSIKLGSGVKKIGMYSFSEASITEMVFPDSVEQVGESVLSGCTKLKKITLSKKMTTIPTYFCSNTAITEMYIPDNITVIGSTAFYQCRSLEKVDISPNVTSIRSAAFQNCTSLTQVKFPKELDTIWSNAFEGCSSLAIVTLPEKLKYLEHQAFIACPALKSVIIKSSDVMFYSDCPVGYDKSRNKIDGVTIYGTAGSTAQEYASSNGFVFKNISEAPNDPALSLDLSPKDSVKPVVTKKANPIKAKGKTVKVKYKKLKKKNLKLKRSAVITIKNAKGTLSFKKKSGNKKIVIDKKTGKLTVKKGLKKGKYKVKIKVTAKGNTTYKAGTKTVTVIVKVI